MNYIGSKLSLLEFLNESINKVVDENCNVFCDLFAGTGNVGVYFKKKGYEVISNDIQYYSYVLNRNYIGNNSDLLFAGLNKIIPLIKKADIEDRKNLVCKYLENLTEVEGFIYKNYCPGGTKNMKEPRLYFSDKNGMKCDAIRQEIANWKMNNLISDDEYYFLLTSLIESIDKYANTASVYGAFLKKLKKSAQKTLFLNSAKLFKDSKGNHQIFNENANEVIKVINSDILYLDPPYNQRQYSTNYHLLETIARYDNPVIYGKTGLRDYSNQKSLYCSKSMVKEAFQDLIIKANAKYIFLSYNNEGLMSPDEIKEIMSIRGKYGFFKKDYVRFKADKSEKRNYTTNITTEYLHYIKVEKPTNSFDPKIN